MSTRRLLQEGELPQYRRLMESFYGIGHYETRDSHFQWMHARRAHLNPTHVEGTYSVHGAFEDGAIRAAVEFMPVWLYEEEDRSRSVLWTVNWISEPGYELEAMLCLNELRRHHSMHLSFGATERVREIRERAGYGYSHGIPRYISIHDFKASLDLSDPMFKNDPAFRYLLQELAEAATEGDHSPSAVIGGQDSLDHGYWANHLAENRYALDRSPAYLEWRYRQHPSINYYIVSTDDLQTAGLAVIRIEKESATGHSVARLLEILNTEGRREQLIKAVCCFAKEQGCAFTDFFCSSSPYLHTLPMPFVRIEGTASRGLPRLFQPLEYRDRTSLNLSWHVHDQEIGLLQDADGPGLYITKGDPGQDVAVNRGYRTIKE